MTPSDRYYPCLFCGKLTPRRLVLDDCPPAPSCSVECDTAPVHIRDMPGFDWGEGHSEAAVIWCTGPAAPPVVAHTFTDSLRAVVDEAKAEGPAAEAELAVFDTLAKVACYHLAVRAFRIGNENAQYSLDIGGV